MGDEKHILLAEDEEHIAKLVSFKLSKGGFQVSIAKNGQEAIDNLATKPWNLIILDIMMPLKNGWEVLQAIRGSTDSRLASTPVLMLSAKGAQKDVANAAELRADQYLKKPFDPTELLQTVQKLARQ